MIKRHNCSVEGCEGYRYKNKLCLSHFKAQNPEKFKIKASSKLLERKLLKPASKPLKKVSKKQQERLEKYRLLRDDYMKQHSICEFEGCNHKADDLHHTELRQGDSLFRGFMAVCRAHHEWIHTHSKEAREKGYLV